MRSTRSFRVGVGWGRMASPSPARVVRLCDGAAGFGRCGGGRDDGGAPGGGAAEIGRCGGGRDDGGARGGARGRSRQGSAGRGRIGHFTGDRLVPGGERRRCHPGSCAHGVAAGGRHARRGVARRRGRPPNDGGPVVGHSASYWQWRRLRSRRRRARRRRQWLVSRWPPSDTRPSRVARWTERPSRHGSHFF